MATPATATPLASPAPATLPVTGFLRLKQIIGDKKASPPIPAIIPISNTYLWEKVKAGLFPKPVKLGPRTTAWRVEDVREWIAKQREAA